MSDHIKTTVSLTDRGGKKEWGNELEGGKKIEKVLVVDRCGTKY